jgi:hypothetical protein
LRLRILVTLGLSARCVCSVSERIFSAALPARLWRHAVRLRGVSPRPGATGRPVCSHRGGSQGISVARTILVPGIEHPGGAAVIHRRGKFGASAEFGFRRRGHGRSRPAAIVARARAACWDVKREPPGRPSRQQADRAGAVSSSCAGSSRPRRRTTNRRSRLYASPRAIWRTGSQVLPR